MSINKSMFLTTFTWDGDKYESFRLIPISNDCPYTEAFYDPELKVLVLFAKEKKEHFTTLPKIDQYGQELSKNDKPLLDRHRVTTFNEYYIDRADEIREFLKLFAINIDTYNYNKYLEGLIELTQVKKYSNKHLTTASF